MTDQDDELWEQAVEIADWLPDEDESDLSNKEN